MPIFTVVRVKPIIRTIKFPAFCGYIPKTCLTWERILDLARSLCCYRSVNFRCRSHYDGSVPSSRDPVGTSDVFPSIRLNQPRDHHSCSLPRSLQIYYCHGLMHQLPSSHGSVNASFPLRHDYCSQKRFFLSF